MIIILISFVVFALIIDFKIYLILEKTHLKYIAFKKIPKILQLIQQYLILNILILPSGIDCIFLLIKLSF
jgi:hypothetical protein